MAQNTTAAERTGPGSRALVKLAACWISLPLFSLATGGSIARWEAWASCAAIQVPMTLFVAYIVRRDPGYLARRFRMREKERARRHIIQRSWTVVLLTTGGGVRCLVLWCWVPASSGLPKEAAFP